MSETVLLDCRGASHAVNMDRLTERGKVIDRVIVVNTDKGSQPVVCWGEAPYYVLCRIPPHVESGPASAAFVGGFIRGLESSHQVPAQIKTWSRFLVMHGMQEMCRDSVALRKLLTGNFKAPDYTEASADAVEMDPVPRRLVVYCRDPAHHPTISEEYVHINGFKALELRNIKELY
jgi:hypothetical protein